MARTPQVRPVKAIKRRPVRSRTDPSTAEAPPVKARRTRDAEGTRQRILDAAVEEFTEHGLSGARIDSIAQRSGANMRMIYHYYGSKEELYVYVLDHVYEDIRQKEASLNLSNLEPFEAMMKLFNFTFDHFEANPHVISLWTGENLQRGRYLATSLRAASLSSPLLDAIRATLARGEELQVFRPGIDPLQLYVSMVALSYFHLSNSYTLSAIFRTDLHSAEWKQKRQQHAQEMIATYLVHGIEKT
ncbi:MAG: TetR/AcrR family transcriptional regulator [Oxalobacteraceae bacterium]|nr:MAG: TetR/AcrR family transcriptional regulator [Oxalobacteraceae bacterium]